MPNRTIYIRKEDVAKWDVMPRKSEKISQLVQDWHEIENNPVASDDAIQAAGDTAPHAKPFNYNPVEDAGNGLKKMTIGINELPPLGRTRNEIKAEMDSLEVEYREAAAICQDGETAVQLEKDYNRNWDRLLDELQGVTM